MITQEELKEHLHYDPETGVFTWLKPTSNRVKKGSIARNKDKAGYRIISIKCQQYKAHRLAWLYVYGEFPAGILDHINRVKSDNRISNLREASKAENAVNTGIRKNNTTGYTGVRRNMGCRTFSAYVCLNYKNIYLGSFATAEEASLAYQKATSDLRGNGGNSNG